MAGKGHANYERYKSYYINRETSAAGKAKRVERDQARTLEIKSGALTGPNDKRTVDHIKPLSKGGGNAKTNLRITSGKANRSKFNH